MNFKPNVTVFILSCSQVQPQDISGTSRIFLLNNMSGLFDLCLQTIISATLLNLFLMEEGAHCMHTQEPLDLESMKTNKEVCNWPGSHRTERQGQARQSLSATNTTEARISKNGRETGKRKPRK